MPPLAGETLEAQNARAQQRLGRLLEASVSHRAPKLPLPEVSAWLRPCVEVARMFERPLMQVLWP